VLPIASIVILYFIKSTLVRLGVIVAFTVLFAVALMLVTQAKRVEVFAATSAYVVLHFVIFSHATFYLSLPRSLVIFDFRKEKGALG
jgi:hypothetical protein